MRYSSLRDGFGVDRSSPLPARLGFPRKRFQMASEEPWSLSAVATMKNRPQSRKNLFTRGSEKIVAAPCVAPSLPSIWESRASQQPDLIGSFEHGLHKLYRYSEVSYPRHLCNL